MFKIEKQQVNPMGAGRGRWQEADPARFESREDAERLQRALVREEMNRATKDQRSTPLPHFRVVRALQVVACMVLQ